MYIIIISSVLQPTMKTMSKLLLQFCASEEFPNSMKQSTFICFIRICVTRFPNEELFLWNIFFEIIMSPGWLLYSITAGQTLEDYTSFKNGFNLFSVSCLGFRDLVLF